MVAACPNGSPGPSIRDPAHDFLSIAAASLVLWSAYRALAKKSKLLRVERFDLRVRKADELLGRDADVANLKALVEDSSLLLVDGEFRLREIFAD